MVRDDMRQDIRRINIKWKRVGGNGELLKKIVEVAETHIEF